MKSEERSSFGIGSGLALLANLIVVIQFAGKHMAVAVLAVLAAWVVGITYGRRILRWLLRYRRDLLFLILGGALASASLGGALLSRTEASTPCPPPPATTPCPDTPTPTPTPDSTPIPGVVYRTPSGKKYHLANCRHLKGRDVTAIPLADVRKAGLTPCKDCHPPPLP